MRSLHAQQIDSEYGKREASVGPFQTRAKAIKSGAEYEAPSQGRSEAYSTRHNFTTKLRLVLWRPMVVPIELTGR